MPIKLIVTDLDDTLLRRDKTISDYTAEVFKQCRAQGILIAFATARGGRSIKRWVEQIQPDALITSGGARARRGEQEIYNCNLPKELANELLQLCMAEPSVGYITVDTTHNLLVNKAFDVGDPLWRDFAHALMMEFAGGIDCNAQKIAVEFDDPYAAARIAAKFDEVATLHWTGEKWHQLSHKNATKKHAVEAVAKHFGVAIEDVVAFGDDHNDVGMLELAGIGVAMQNAIDKVKAAADDICGSCDEDGVAQWLEQNVLIEKQTQAQLQQ